MSGNISIKISALLWYIVQCSVHNLLIRYSRARDVQDMFYPSVAVFFTEIVKLVFCLIMISREEETVLKVLKTRILDEPSDTIKVCIPAILYTVQNNLTYIAATHLEAAPLAIISQLKIFAAVVFSILLLKRHPSWIQWFSFLILFAGVSLVQFQTNESQKLTTNKQNPIFGFCVSCLASLISGFAGIFLEKILKESVSVSVWMRNIQMAIFAIPASFVGALIQDGSSIKENGFLFGFDLIVWAIILWYGIGGLSAAVCIKYVGTIEKDFATGFAIILSTIGSIFIFNFIPSLTFIFGAFFVIFSIILYNSSDTIFKAFYKYSSYNFIGT